MRKNAPFDISDNLVEAISEKSSRKKVTASLPSDTYSDTFSKVHYYGDGKTGSLTNLLYKPTNVSFFGGKKKCQFIFWNFSCKWTILLKDAI